MQRSLGDGKGMPIEDTREIDAGSRLEADLAIIGSGPAGLSLAQEFAGSRFRVVVLESGGLEETEEKIALNGTECTGAPRLSNPQAVRNRVFGGTSHTWAGRCRPFDEIDFEQRDWVPHSGWPLTLSDLEPFIARAGRTLNLGPHVNDDSIRSMLGRDEIDPPVNSDLLRYCFWQYARSPGRSLDFLRFGKEFLKLNAPNVQVLINATVTGIETNENGRELQLLEVTGCAGQRFTLIPKVAVLCAGAIENARLLLASNHANPNGLGNDADMVGRFLMDHQRMKLGEFVGNAAKAVQSQLGLFRVRHAGRVNYYTSGLALSPAVQRKEKLLNCAAYLSEQRAADDPWDALKRLSTRSSENALHDVLAVASSPALVTRGLFKRAVAGSSVPHKVDKFTIDCLVEQVPDPESRITLSDKRDSNGVPVARLQWKVSDLEKRSAIKLGKLLASEVERLGFKPPALAEWVRNDSPSAAIFTDVAHPSGTTRMTADAKSGVVDRNCKVHGVDRLYICGSSTFPTAGHANPTLMNVAMTLRLADWLKQKHLMTMIVITTLSLFMTFVEASEELQSDIDALISALF